MGRSWWGKFFALVFITILSAVYVYPTLANLDLDKTKFPFKQKISLGLDLQGGLYMVLGVDFDRVYKDVVQRQASSLPSRAADKGIQGVKVDLKKGTPNDDPQVSVTFDQAKRDELYALVKKEYWALRLAGEQPGMLDLGLSREFRGEVRERTINQSIEVIRNRIDEFGVSEPVIATQGTDRIVVELPGVREIDRAKDLIGRTAKLEFKIVNDEAMNEAQLAALVADLEKTKGISLKDSGKFSDYARALNEAAKGKIPADSEIAFEKLQLGDTTDAGVRWRPFLLHSRADVTGDDLSDATVQIDPETRSPNVGFSFNPRGAQAFGKLTETNIHKRLAIVLDNLVHSAPVIQSKISEHGQITLGRGNEQDLMKEAKDLAIVLRAGALPAQLEFLEQRVVGPSLGQDSIHKGALAALIGALAVFALVWFYYRLSGAIAVFSLVLNVLFVLAMLVGLEATLTLPGIAGIALTVGIAVDSNIVIYERIREELRAGKRPHGAVEAGFQKAFRTILDANVTNAAAAIVLLMYGTGPIKGFAVTMLIGIVTTLFTAVFVCKVLFDYYLRKVEERGGETLSI